jgi:hypothetical protein
MRKLKFFYSKLRQFHDFLFPIPWGFAYLSRALLYIAVLLSGSGVMADQRPVFNSGLLASPADFLKTKLLGDKPSSSLPPRLDLSSRMPPPGDQKQQASCVAWAVGYGARSYYLGLQGTDLHNKNQLPSPSYIYNQIKPSVPFGCETGSRIPDALSLLKSQGVATLGEFSYNPQVCNKKPDQSIKAAALRNVISDWKTIRSGDIAAVKAELYKGNPVMFAMWIDETFLGHFGDKTYVNRHIPLPLNGHAMIIVGYDDMRNAFKIFNSWGTGWGKGGMAWIDYETMRKRGSEFYVMEVKTAMPPAPEPVNTDQKVDPSPSPPSPNRPDEIYPKSKDIKEAANKIEVLSVGIDCGRIDSKIDNWGIVHLEGFMGKPDQLSKLTQAIMRIKGVRHVESAVRITPWPLCEAYLAMDSLPKSNKKIVPTVLDHPDNVLAVGDLFGIEVTAPKTSGYMYIAYLQSNGEAVKFYWGKSYTPGQIINISGPGYKVSAPTGKELLLVIASSKPLWEDEVNDSTKPDKKFLSLLRKGLHDLKPKEQARVNYGVVEILTQMP